jgi:hypothetical protein
MREMVSFGTTTRRRLSAFQTLSLDSRWTEALSWPRSSTSTPATKKCAAHHPLHCLPNQDKLYFIRDIKVLQNTAPTDYFLLNETYSLFCKTYPAKFWKYISPQAWRGSRSRHTFMPAYLSIQKNPSDSKESKGLRSIPSCHSFSCGTTTRRRLPAFQTTSYDSR